MPSETIPKLPHLSSSSLRRCIRNVLSSQMLNGEVSAWSTPSALSRAASIWARLVEKPSVTPSVEGVIRVVTVSVPAAICRRSSRPGTLMVEAIRFCRVRTKSRTSASISAAWLEASKARLSVTVPVLEAPSALTKRKPMRTWPE
ncbi:hypothetical protein D9M72_601310 [compost metagenome]